METFVVWLLDKAMLVVPEKKRMAAFNYLKKILRQVLNFFRKAIKTAELETIQETAPEGAKAVGTFRIQRLKPICSITMTRDFPNEYTILELTYEPEKEVFPFEKVRNSIPLYEASFGGLLESRTSARSSRRL